MNRSLVVCLWVAGATGCGIADFDISQAVPSQTIQGSNLPGPLAGVFPIPLSLDLDSKIKAQNTGPIDSVTLHELTLDITSTGGDWSFVSKIDVYVESTKQGTTLQKTHIAAVSSPGKVRSLSFDVDGDVNLKPFIEEGSQVDSSGSGTQPTQDTTYNGKATFTVHPF